MTNAIPVSEIIIAIKRISTRYSPIFLGLLSGFAVFYFLYFFGAYGIQKGMSYSGHSHLFRSLSFGVLTLVYLIVCESFFKPKSVNQKTVYALIWYSALIVFGSHLIFILFNYFWNWQEWTVSAYVLIMKEFPLMMVLPICFYLVIKASINKEVLIENYLLFQSENGKDQLKISSKDFLYANSSENYITIFYTLNKNTREHLIRKPLKVLAQELEDRPNIMRIHRSYLVNKQSIQAVKQGRGKVHIEIDGKALPVSKQLQSHFLI